MDKKQYEILVGMYGKEKANKALAWWKENPLHRAIKPGRQAQFCIDNEFLWF